MVSKWRLPGDGNRSQNPGKYNGPAPDRAEKWELTSDIMMEWFTLVFAVGFVTSSVVVLLVPPALPRRIRGSCYAVADETPENRVGLLLGCTRLLPSGKPNLYFRYRIEAAAELYRAGKVDKLLASGASHRGDVDEAASMKEALIEAGVPEPDIVCDPYGYRTIDSVIRSQAVYGLDRMTIISQGFHNRRAIYIAEYWDIDAIGFDARDVEWPGGRKVRFREYFARLRVLIDLHVLAIGPRVTGPSTPL
jgi:SanA protein